MGGVFGWKKSVLIIAIILIGSWLRFHALVQDVRFAPDEALFSTFARGAAINGDWWFPGPLDKPPLALYANALAQVFVGDSEFAARLPGTLASILLIAAVYAVGQAIYLPHTDKYTVVGEGLRPSPTDRPPLIALILTALSPFAIAFSASAYTDGMMLLGCTLALLLAARGHWGWAGFWLGAAFASKQQALFYLPLLLLLGWTTGDLTRRRGLRFASGLGVMIGLLWLWDLARPGTSLFALAWANNDPRRLIHANELLPRLLTWLEHGRALLGPGWLTLLLVIVAISGVIIQVKQQPRQRATVIDLTLLMFVVTYGLLHWLVAFNTYDRYLLLILPPLILLATRGLDILIHSVLKTGQAVPQRIANLTLLVGLIALSVSGFAASERRVSVNRDGDPYIGIDELAAYLNAQPVATVIYDRWLGWELGYYLGQWHDKRMVYYPAPHLLVADALKLCEIGPRYFPAPATQAVGPWLTALDNADFTIEQTFANTEFVVYQLRPPWKTTAACDDVS